MATAFAKANKPTTGPMSLFWCCCAGPVLDEEPDIFPEAEVPQSSHIIDEVDNPPEDEAISEHEELMNIVPEPVPWGQINLSLKYDFAKQRLRIKLTDLKSFEDTHAYRSKVLIRVIVVPSGKQKYKTKAKPLGQDSKFRYQFNVEKITAEDTETQGLAISLFEEKSYPYSPLAESIFWLSEYSARLQGNEEINESSTLICTTLPYERLNTLGFDTSHTISTAVSMRSLNTLGDSSTVNDSTPFGTIRSTTSAARSIKSVNVLHSVMPLQGAAEREAEPSIGGEAQLLVALSQKPNSAQFICEIIRVRNLMCLFPDPTKVAPNAETFVRIAVMSSTGFLLSRNRTSVRKSSTNPVYGESFVFRLSREQLMEVTLLLTVYHRKAGRQEMLGWCSLGYNNSSNEAKSHWMALQNSEGGMVCSWHTFQK